MATNGSVALQLTTGIEGTEHGTLTHLCVGRMDLEVLCDGVGGADIWTVYCTTVSAGPPAVIQKADRYGIRVKLLPQDPVFQSLKAALTVGGQSVVQEAMVIILTLLAANGLVPPGEIVEVEW